MVRNLRLSGETIAKIFTNKITNWNDPAITKDNNGKALPSIPIIPVVRADGAGVTNQFTTWMVSQYPSAAGRTATAASSRRPTTSRSTAARPAARRRRSPAPTAS